MSTPDDQKESFVVDLFQEAALAAVWAVMFLVILAITRYMVIQPYATKFNRLVGTVLAVTTGVEVGNFTSITPEQAALIRSSLKQTVKEGIDFGFDKGQERFRRVASDPAIKQDFKEAIEFTAETWYRKAPPQQ